MNNGAGWIAGGEGSTSRGGFGEVGLGKTKSAGRKEAAACLRRKRAKNW